MASLVDQLSAFRANAWFVSPIFGAEIDKLLLDAPLGMGSAMPLPESTSVTDTLTRISNGLADAARAANLSLKNYFDARTSIDQMVAANRAGVPVDVYAVTGGARNTAASFISDPNSPIPSVLGVPIWVIIGGAALFLFVSRR